MAFLAGMPKPPAYPSGRYIHTNPLRREWGLRLLTEHLPMPLRWTIIRAWHRPGASSRAMFAPELPNPYRQRPDDAFLLSRSPHILGDFSLVELELSRRLVEAPQASILPVTRNAMLSAQSVYLRRLYSALAWQIGEAAALAVFKRLIASID